MTVDCYCDEQSDVLPNTPSIGEVSFLDQSETVFLQSSIDSQFDAQYESLGSAQRASDLMLGSLGEVPALGFGFKIFQLFANDAFSRLRTDLQSRSLAATQLAVDQNRIWAASASSRPGQMRQAIHQFNLQHRFLFRSADNDRDRAEVLFSNSQVALSIAAGLGDQAHQTNTLLQSGLQRLDRLEGAISNVGNDVGATRQDLNTAIQRLSGLETGVLNIENNVAAIRAFQQSMASGIDGGFEELTSLHAQLSNSVSGVMDQLDRQNEVMANMEIVSALVFDEFTTIDTAGLEQHNRLLAEQLAYLDNLKANNAPRQEILDAANRARATYDQQVESIRQIEAKVAQITQFSGLLSTIGAVTNNPNLGKVAAVINGVVEISKAIQAFSQASTLVGALGSMNVMTMGLGMIFSAFGGGGSSNAMQQVLNILLPKLNQISEQIEHLHTYVGLRADRTDELVQTFGEAILESLQIGFDRSNRIVRVEVDALRRLMTGNQRQMLGNFLAIRSDINQMRLLVEDVAQDVRSIQDSLDAIANQIQLTGYNAIITEYVNFYDTRVYNPLNPALDPTITYQRFLSLRDYATRGATATAVHGDIAGRYDLSSVAGIQLDGALSRVNLLLGFVRAQYLLSWTPVSLPENLSVTFDLPYAPPSSVRLINPLVWAQSTDDIMKFINRIPELQLRSGDRRVIQDVIAYGEEFLKNILALKISSQWFESLIQDYKRSFEGLIDLLYNKVLEALVIDDASLRSNLSDFHTRANQASALELVVDLDRILGELRTIMSGLGDQYHNCQLADYRHGVGAVSFPFFSSYNDYNSGFGVCLHHFIDSERICRTSMQGRPMRPCYAPDSMTDIGDAFSELLNYESNCQSEPNRRTLEEVQNNRTLMHTRLQAFNGDINELISAFQSIIAGNMNESCADPLISRLVSLQANQPDVVSFSQGFFDLVSRADLVTVCRPEQFDQICNYPMTETDISPGNPYGPNYFYPAIDINLNLQRCETECQSYTVEDNSRFPSWYPSREDPEYDYRRLMPCERLTMRSAPNTSLSFNSLRDQLRSHASGLTDRFQQYAQYLSDLSTKASRIQGKFELRHALDSCADLPPVVRLSILDRWLQTSTDGQRQTIQASLLSDLVDESPLRRTLGELTAYRNVLELMLRFVYGTEFFNDMALKQQLLNLWTGEVIERAIGATNISNASTFVFNQLYEHMLNKPVVHNVVVGDLPWHNLTDYLGLAAESARHLNNQSLLSPDYRFIVDRLQSLYFIRDMILPRGMSPIDITASVIADAYENNATEVLSAIDSQGIHVDDTIDATGNSPYMLLVERCNQTALSIFFSQASNINLQRLNNDGASALNLALSCPLSSTRHAMLRFLLNQGVVTCLATDALQAALMSSAVSVERLAAVNCFEFTTPSMHAGSTTYRVNGGTVTSPAEVSMPRQTVTVSGMSTSATKTIVPPGNFDSNSDQGSGFSSAAFGVIGGLAGALLIAIGVIIYHKGKSSGRRELQVVSPGVLNPVFNPDASLQNSRRDVNQEMNVGSRPRVTHPSPAMVTHRLQLPTSVVVMITILGFMASVVATRQSGQPTGSIQDDSKDSLARREIGALIQQRFQYGQHRVQDQSSLKTLYMKNLPPNLHFAEYLKLKWQSPDVITNSVAWVFADFTGLLTLFLSVCIWSFCLEREVEQCVELVAKDQKLSRRIHRLSVKLERYQQTLNQAVERYPGHSFGWAGFCLHDHLHRVSVLSEGCTVDLIDLDAIEQDVRVFKRELWSELAELRGVGLCNGMVSLMQSPGVFGQDQNVNHVLPVDAQPGVRLPLAMVHEVSALSKGKVSGIGFFSQSSQLSRSAQLTSDLSNDPSVLAV